MPTQVNEHRRSFSLRRAAYFVLSAALFLTLGFGYYSFHTVLSESQDRFEQDVHRSVNAIQDRLNTYINTLNQTKGFFLAHPRVTREEFRIYVERIEVLQKFPGVQGIGFTKRIPRRELAAHVAAMRAAGNPKYKVWPGHGRDEYFSVVYLEPFDWRNQRAFGYDMFTQPTRRAAMQAAWDTGAPAMTGMVTLVQETISDTQPGFLIYVPLYRTSHGQAPRDRRRDLIGFVYSPFRAHDFFAGALKQHDIREMRIEVYDGGQTDLQSLLYATEQSGKETFDKPAFTRTEKIHAAGHEWTVVAEASAAYIDREDFFEPLLILVLGALLSLMMFRVLKTEERRIAATERSRGRMIEILESIGDAFVSVDRAWRFAYVNQAAGRLAGRRPEELIGKKIWDEFPFTNDLRMRQHLETAQREQRMVQSEEWVSAFNAWLHVRVYPSDHRLSIYARDITEEKLATDALAAERERLRVTLYSIADAVITTDTGGCVALINKAAEELTGWTQAEARGRQLEDLVLILNPRTRKALTSPAKKVLATGRAVEGQEHSLIVTRSGAERTISLACSPIQDNRGVTVGAVLVLRDITRQLETEQELIKARNLEAIGVLAGGIAHDFNNILTAILGNIALAKLYIDGSNQAVEILGEAESASLRARDLIQQLLTFAKGGMPIKKTASIAEVLKETAVFVLRGSPISCEFDIAPDLWPAEFDAGQISQVINNLVLNAQQALPEGGIVRITARNAHIAPGELPGIAPGNYIRIEVLDRGVGIPAEHLAKIFDPYFTTKEQGAGLGLATAYSIVRRHGGHIGVESRPGEGTVFTIYLPAVPGASLPGDRNEKRFPARGHGHVLVMDDEEPVRKIAAALLAALGYTVEVAKDGEEALAIYAARMQAGVPFDAVIVDLTVPGGMGGQECVARIREIDPDVNAIVSSGYSTDPVMAKHAEFGFVAGIAKPFELATLGEAMRVALASRRRAGL